MFSKRRGLSKEAEKAYVLPQKVWITQIPSLKNSSPGYKMNQVKKFLYPKIHEHPAFEGIESDESLNLMFTCFDAETFTLDEGEELVSDPEYLILNIEDRTYLKLKYFRVIRCCAFQCAHHSRLQQNLLKHPDLLF